MLRCLPWFRTLPGPGSVADVGEAGATVVPVGGGQGLYDVACFQGAVSGWSSVPFLLDMWISGTASLHLGSPNRLLGDFGPDALV